MKGRFVLLGLVASAAALASCAGGSGPASAPARPAIATATPAARPLPARANATLRLTIPAPRTPSYVSASAMSVSVDSYTVSGGAIQGGIFATTSVNLTAPACTTGTPRVCTIAAVAPTGQAAFGITLYDQVSGGGNALATLLPNAALATTIAADVQNVIPPLVLGGVPASITVAASGVLQAGSPTSIPVTVAARDAQNNLIFGDAPYANPITLTSSATSGSVTFSSTVTAPTTSVTLNFDGNSPDGSSRFVTIGATAAGVSPANVTTPAPIGFTPAPLALCASGCSGLANGPAPYALGVTETGYGGTVSATITGTGCNLNSTSASVSGGSGSILVYGNPAGGTCSVSATDGYGQTANAGPSFNVAGAPTVLASPCSPGVFPPDPNGGVLRVSACGLAVRYGSYTAFPFDSNYNPLSFQLDTYANVNVQPVKTQTINGNRYISSTTIVAPPSAAPQIQYIGQNGATLIAPSTLYP